MELQDELDEFGYVLVAGNGPLVSGGHILKGPWTMINRGTGERVILDFKMVISGLADETDLARFVKQTGHAPEGVLYRAVAE
jgi:hypothetical protein